MQKHPYGTIREGKIYLNAFLDFPEREIGEVKENAESTIKYFEERFNALEQKINALEEAISTSDNKGSYLMKLIHLKNTLAHHDGLGNYVPLFDKLHRLEADLNLLIAHNREKNLAIKNSIIEELRLLKETHDFKAGTEKFNELREKWIKTGSVGKEQEESIELTFKDLKDDFFARRKSYFEDKKALIDSRIEKYEAIIEEVRKSALEDDVVTTVRKIKLLEEKWKKIGEIPYKINKELWSSYKSVTNPVFEKYKILKKGYINNAERKGNKLDYKKQLLEQAQALCDNPAPNVLDAIKRLQLEWKKSGNLSKDQVNGLKEEFFLACDKARELSFINKIAIGKNKDFHQKPLKDQIRIKIHLLKDLLYRDEKDLQLFTENSHKFSSDANTINHLLNNKLVIQKRKVEVKKLLLSSLQEQFSATSN